MPGGQVILCDESKLSSYDSLDTTNCVLRAARRPLIIDDVTFTGGRVRRYRDALNRCNLMHDDDAVRVLFGVARPMRPVCSAALLTRALCRVSDVHTADGSSASRYHGGTNGLAHGVGDQLLKDRAGDSRRDSRVGETPIVECLESGLNADEVFLRLPSAGALALGLVLLGARDPIETIACVASGIEEMRIQGRLRPCVVSLSLARSISRPLPLRWSRANGDPVMNLERGSARWFEGILAASILRACDPTNIVNHHTADHSGTTPTMSSEPRLNSVMTARPSTFSPSLPGSFLARFQMIWRSSLRSRALWSA